MSAPPGPDREARPPGVLAALERGALACFCAAAFAAALLAARSRLAPFQSPLSFGLVFWGWLLAFYLAVAIPALVAAWTVARVAARRHPRLASAPRWLLAAGALGFLGSALALEHRALPELVALGGPARFRWLLPVAWGAALLGLVAVAASPPAWRGPVRLLALAALGAGGAALWPAPPVLPDPPLLAGALTRQRVLVVGLDGADWALAEQLIARGELPVLTALRERGAWGPLATLRPTHSPEIWTTVFTGWPPERHGIDGFTRRRIRGVNDVLPRLRRQRGTGFETLVERLTRHGIIHEVPVNSDMRRVPAYWTISSAYGTPLNVVSIWPTWPAEEITGAIVTERVPLWPEGRRKQPPEKLTHPGSLYREIAPLVMRPEDVDERVALRFMDVTLDELRELRARPQEGPWDTAHQWDRMMARHETIERIALHLMNGQRESEGRARDTLVWLDLIDKLCHTALHCSELVERRECPPQEARRLSGAVSEAYRTADATLGRLLAAFGDGNAIVISDHGWSEDRHAGTPPYTHRQAPPGIFVASGPAFRSGRVEGLSVFDLLPLLLRLKGFAHAEDLPGRVPEEVFTPSFLAGNPALSVPSYGERGVLHPVGGARSKDHEVMEQLRGLGYVE